MTGILQAERLGVWFGRFEAVRNVSLSVQAGQIHSIIGPNGAGKTTLFNALSGVIQPTTGRVLVDGIDVTRRPIHQRVHLGLARSFQITNLFWTRSVFDNMKLAVRASGGSVAFDMLGPESKDVAATAAALCERIGFSARMETVVDQLSHGEQRLLDVGLTLAAKPRLFLLDEPTSGMGVEDLPTMSKLILSFKSAGFTVVVIEHNMNLVMGISDRITVLHQGAVLAEGSPQSISANPRVKDAYLGNPAPDA
jgi:branched-chain amino acid transport system ATP-binding protein